MSADRAPGAPDAAPGGLPSRGDARVTVLHTGYARRGPEELRVGSTVGLVVSGDAVVVVDPGMVARQELILGPLRDAGLSPDDVTDVVVSHHHPDHTVNVGLFGGARVHDHQAVYRGDLWVPTPAEGRQVAPDVRLAATPGHTREDVSTLVWTPDGVVVFTHAWWTAEGPAEDPYAPDREVLRASRERLLAVATTVLPGHGEAFRPGPGTPR